VAWRLAEAGALGDIFRTASARVGDRAIWLSIASERIQISRIIAKQMVTRPSNVTNLKG
jgi:hypothetical protein